MTLETRSLKQHGLMVSLVAALWATACGGTFTGGGAGGAAGTGATSGAAGAGTAGTAGGFACDVECPAIECMGNVVMHAGDCCPSCEPTGGAGGVSSGGSAGVGGACAATACPAYACAVGYKSVYEPGACCPTCVPDGGGGSGGVGGCAAVDCALPKCAPGYMLEQEPDACCPTCVPNNACTTGQQSYDTLRTKLLSQPGAIACKVAQDCALLGSNAYCGDECSHIPVNAAAAQSINGELSTFAKNNCSTCTPIYPPCAAPPPPACVQGQCVIGMFSGG